MPGVRQAVAERVDAAVRCGREAIAGDEVHARRTEREECVAGADHADAGGAGRIVARPARDDRIAAHSPCVGNRCAQGAGRRRSFDEGAGNVHGEGDLVILTGREKG